MDRFDHDGMTFDVLDEGPGSGVPVILLHGWPQDNTAWESVSPRLHDAGLRTLAPNLRGYSPGARPPERTAYSLDRLTEDVLALLDSAGLEQAHIVGHDWGGGLAYHLTLRHPTRVATLTVLSTPHPGAIAWALAHGTQALKSWYMVAFLVPTVPELVLRRQLRLVLRRSGLPEPYASRYAAAFRDPLMARAALNWYRGNPVTSFARPALDTVTRSLPWASTKLAAAELVSHITVPMTYVWGKDDVALGRGAAERTGDFVDADYRFLELDAGHWLPETRPAEVAEAVIDRVHSGMP